MDESCTLKIHAISAREMAQWVKSLHGKHEDQLSRRDYIAACNPREGGGAESRASESMRQAE